MIKISSSVQDPKKSISIKIDFDTIEYFKKKSKEVGLPYQKLINIYLNTYIKELNNEK